jgi:hypothetical protein
MGFYAVNLHRLTMDDPPVLCMLPSILLRRLSARSASADVRPGGSRKTRAWEVRRCSASGGTGAPGARGLHSSTSQVSLSRF